MPPQLGLLIETFEGQEEASIEAVGTIDEMIQLKENIDTDIRDKFGSLINVLEEAIPGNPPKLFLPTFHVLIVDRQIAFNLNKHFRTHQYYRGVWELINDVSLVEKYV